MAPTKNSLDPERTVGEEVGGEQDGQRAGCEQRVGDQTDAAKESQATDGEGEEAVGDAVALERPDQSHDAGDDHQQADHDRDRHPGHAWGQHGEDAQHHRYDAEGLQDGSLLCLVESVVIGCSPQRSKATRSRNSVKAISRSGRAGRRISVQGSPERRVSKRSPVAVRFANPFQ